MVTRILHALLCSRTPLHLPALRTPRQARLPVPTPTPSALREPRPSLALAQHRADRDPVPARRRWSVLRVGHGAFILPQVLRSLNHGSNYLTFSSSEKEFSFPYSNQHSASLLCLVCRVTEVEAVGIPPSPPHCGHSLGPMGTDSERPGPSLFHPPACPVAPTPPGRLGGAAPRPCLRCRATASATPQPCRPLVSFQ